VASAAEAPSCCAGLTAEAVVALAAPAAARQGWWRQLIQLEREVGTVQAAE